MNVKAPCKRSFLLFYAMRRVTRMFRTSATPATIAQVPSNSTNGKKSIR